MVTKGHTTGQWSLFSNNSNFSNFNRDNTSEILSKLGGYQYFCADIKARSIANKKLRLYSHVPTGRSRISGKTIRIIPQAKPIPVSADRLLFLRGEKEMSHNNLVYKTLCAEKGIVEILNHPALDLIRFINPYSSQWEFLYTLSLSEQIYGNAYSQKVRDSRGIPIELWLAPAQNMQIIQGKTLDNFIDHYRWGEEFGEPHNFDPSEILDFMIPGVGNSQVYGTSKIETTWKYINLMDSSLAFQKAICDNHGRPDFVMSSDSTTVNSEDLKRIERAWNDKYYGPEQAGKMALAPGKVKIDVLPRSEFDFNTDKALIQAIATGFNIPEYKVLGSSPIAANASQQEKDFLEAVDSDLTMIEDILNKNLLPDFPGTENMFFAFDPVIVEDKKFAHKKNIDNKKAGIITANESRASIGLEPVEGGDVLRTDRDTPEPTEDKKEIIIPEKNIDYELRSKIDNIISKMSENNSDKKEVTPIQINIKSDAIIEEVVEEVVLDEVEDIVEEVDDGQKGLSEEINNIDDGGEEGEVINKDNIDDSEESLSDKIANRIKNV